jgi:diaminopimelate epimerase
MPIRFTKMHGLGNDFMVIDGINQNLNLNPEKIAFLAKRNTGIGFDQCLLIEPSLKDGIDFNYRIFNSDGQEVGQCGNGARCLALFAKHYGLTTKNNLTVATKTTRMNLQINKDNSVSVNMGVPSLDPATIPLIAEHQLPVYALELTNGTTVSIHAISVGNPHAVLLVQDIHAVPVDSLGKQISLHQRFPEQTNTGFMQIINAQKIKLRVYERGCGETRACGSGAVAAAAIGRLYHHLSEQITVQLPGGDLIIDWPELNGAIRLTGPATFVYEATLL